MSVNKHKQVICDVTKIILDDGVTLIPGFIELKDGKVLEHFSDDPFIGHPWELHNKVEYRRVEEVGTAKLRNGMHFVDGDAYNKVIERMEEKILDGASTKKS